MSYIEGVRAAMRAAERGCSVFATYFKDGPHDWHLFHGTMAAGDLRHIATFPGEPAAPWHIEERPFMAALENAANMPTLPRPNPPVRLSPAAPEGFMYE